MSMKNNVLSLAAAVALAAAIAGCGSAPKGPGQATPSSAATAAAATTEGTSEPFTSAPGLGVGTGVNGKWTLYQVEMTDGGTIAIPATAGAGIEIVGTNAMINTGCNTGSATIGSSADAAVLGPVALTKKACPSEPHTTLETAMLQVMDGQPTVAVRDGKLVIDGDAGTLTYVKA